MFKRKLATIGLGVVTVVVVITAGEWVCGQLLKSHGPLKRKTWLTQGKGDKDHREVFGPDNTRFGLFPTPPPPIKEKPLPKAKHPLITRTEPPDVFVRIGPGPLRVPERSYRSIRYMSDGTVIWDLEYKIDEFHRRFTPGESEKNADRFLILLGDSQIFGDGVNEDQTLAYHVGKELPRTRVYNYGIMGLYPGEMLERLRLVKGAPEVVERKGAVLCFYADYHMTRMMGSYAQLARWGYTKPYYHSDSSGKIVSEGTWEEQKPFWTTASKYLIRSNILSYFVVDWPSQPSREDWRFYVEMLTQIRDESKKIGADEFRVVLYPGLAKSSHLLIPYLEEAGLSYIDLSKWDLGTLTKGPSLIPFDGHPTAESNEVLAKGLIDSLGLRSP